MSKNRLWLLIAIAIAAIGLVGLYAVPSDAVHPDVPLKDVDGNPIPQGSNVPYSPKQTCSGCHFDCDNDPSNGIAYCTTQTNNFKDYEDNIATATKQQTVKGIAYPSYEVKYPKSGVSAGFHFHQGRNVPWGDVQRNYYGVQSFTLSGGMYGKY